ncbi:unnamed protein product [Gongylonema pulchrum]|uniref:Uncharacterized protein n=1 Tax=Gongylonema pulchrum TaxID=637853 RepID=A0A183D916_9BILA|nr:unnamed protein product [Gongylonema pulchrum]
MYILEEFKGGWGKIIRPGECTLAALTCDCVSTTPSLPGFPQYCFFVQDNEPKETLVVYNGTNASAFLLSIISQGLRGDARKRLTLLPTVMVFFTETDKFVIDSLKAQAERHVEHIPGPWIFVHIAAVFDAHIADPRTSRDVCGINKVTLCTGCCYSAELSWLVFCIRTLSDPGLCYSATCFGSAVVPALTLSSLSKQPFAESFLEAPQLMILSSAYKLKYGFCIISARGSGSWPILRVF